MLKKYKYEVIIEVEAESEDTAFTEVVEAVFNGDWTPILVSVTDIKGGN